MNIKIVRKQALERDNYACRFCGSKDNLDIHHIDGNGCEEKTPNINNDPNNVITLCHACHLKLHGQSRPTPHGAHKKRNDNILRYRRKGLSLRAVGKMFHLTHTQIDNICKGAEKPQD